MRALLTISVVAVLLVMVLGSTPAHTVAAPQKVSCGRALTVPPSNKPELITYHGGKGTGVPENINCSWTIDIEQEAYFQMKDFYLTDEDTFTIFDLDKNLTLFGPFSGRQGAIVIATVAGNLSLVLRTSAEVFQRTFMVEVQKSCTAWNDGIIYKFNGVQSGSLRSPLYSKSHGGSFTCLMLLTGFGTDKKPDVLSVSIAESNISKGKISLRDKHLTFGGEFDFVHESPPALMLTKSTLQVNLTIDREIENQYLVLEFEVVSEKCSKIINLTASNRAEVVSLNVENEVVPNALACHWRISAPPKSEIHTQFHALKLIEMQDNILVTGSLKSNFKPIVINSAYRDLYKGYLLMPADQMIFKFNSARTKNGTLIRFTVSLDDQKTVLGQGNISLNKSSVIHNDLYFQVNENERLQLNWSSSPPIGTLISLYTSFNSSAAPLMQLMPHFQLASLTLPTHQLRLAVQHLDHSWFLSFKGVSRDTCDQVQSGDSILFETSESCKRTTCSWIVPPLDKNGVFEVSFPKLLLSDSDHINIFKMDMGPIVKFSGTKSIPVFQTPATEGLLILIETSCSRQDFAVQAFIRLKAAWNKSFELSAGQTAQIDSPNFPLSYPLNTNFHWHISSPRFLLLRFSQFSVADPAHTLLISTPEDTTSVSQSALHGHLNLVPDDKLLLAPVNLRFQTPIVAASVPPGSGFLITATAFECGGVLSSPEGNLSVSHNAHLCIWSVSVPWKRDVGRPHLRVRLVADESHSVKVYDGKSTTNGLLSWDANRTAHSSGSIILVVYQSGEALLRGPVLVFSAEYCNSSNMCPNGKCIQDWWRCNGINECGDYSDEQFCDVTTISSITRTSKQTSTGNPSKEVDSSTFSYEVKTDKIQTDKIQTDKIQTDKIQPTSKGRSTTISTQNTSHENSSENPQEPYDQYTPGVKAADSQSHPGVSHAMFTGSVAGALFCGAVLGWLVTFLVFRQKQKAKQWSTVNSSNHRLSMDNVSL